MKPSMLLGASLAALVGVANAQTAEFEDEIVVTATKRQQTLQEVPVAVSVVDDQVIEEAQITDIIDLQTVVPSLRVLQLERSGNTSFVIRGFGNGSNNAGVEPSVGVFIDGVYRSRSAAAISDLPGLERVEVLRGPQSTLFGKNASAGVISFVTAEPLGELGGEAELTLGNENQRIVKGYLSGPLGDTAGFSLAASSHQRDGYVNNLGGEDINNRDRWAVRGQLLLEPTSDLSIRLLADYDEIDERCCYAANIFAGPTAAAIDFLGGVLVAEDPYGYTTALDQTPINEIVNKGISGTVDWDLGFGSITSITAYREQSSYANGDVDFTTLPAISSNKNDLTTDTFTQEVRLTSDSGGKLEWMLGAFYFDEQLVNNTNVIYGPAFRSYAEVLTANLGAPGVLGTIEGAAMLPPGTFFLSGTGSAGRFEQDNQSVSVFGQADYEVTDRLTATVGLNYTEDRKDVIGGTMNTDLFSQTDLVAVGNGLLYQQAFATTFQAETTLAPTPGNIALVDPLIVQAIMTGAQTFADTVDTVPCTAETGTNCNPLLALRPLQFLPAVVGFPNAVEDGKTVDDNVSYTARLAFDVTPFVNLYGSVATGFKASSFNLSRDTKPFAADLPAVLDAGLGVPNLVPGTRYAGPEESIVYELGLKADFDRINLNVAIFDQTIEGFQSVLFTGTGFELVNAGEQSTTGLEVEATVEAAEGLVLSFAGTFLDPVYDSFTGANAVNESLQQVVVDLSGEKPAGIHETSISVGASYERELTARMTGFVRTNYLYESDVQIVENVPADIASREVNLLSASAGIRMENGLEAMIWGRNLTDDQFLQSAFPTTAQNGSFSGYPNQPRSYGVTVRKSF